MGGGGREGEQKGRKTRLTLVWGGGGGVSTRVFSNARMLEFSGYSGTRA